MALSAETLERLEKVYDGLLSPMFSGLGLQAFAHVYASRPELVADLHEAIFKLKIESPSAVGAEFVQEVERLRAERDDLEGQFRHQKGLTSRFEAMLTEVNNDFASLKRQAENWERDSKILHELTLALQRHCISWHGDEHKIMLSVDGTAISTIEPKDHVPPSLRIVEKVSRPTFADLDPVFSDFINRMTACTNEIEAITERLRQAKAL